MSSSQARALAAINLSVCWLNPFVMSRYRRANIPGATYFLPWLPIAAARSLGKIVTRFSIYLHYNNKLR